MSNVQVNVGTTETLISNYGHFARVHNQLKGVEGETTFWGFDLDGVQDHYAYYTRESAEDAAVKAIEKALAPTTMETLIEERNKITAQLRYKATVAQPDVVASWSAYDYITATATDPQNPVQEQGFYYQEAKAGVVHGTLDTGEECRFPIEDWTFDNITLQEEQD
jgi:hypothetical protein